MQQGLLWVWPESGADAWLEAAATPPDTVPDMTNPSYAGAQGGFAFMENPASLPIMLVRHLPVCKYGRICTANYTSIADDLKPHWIVRRRMPWIPAMPLTSIIW